MGFGLLVTSLSRWKAAKEFYLKTDILRDHGIIALTLSKYVIYWLLNNKKMNSNVREPNFMC